MEDRFSKLFKSVKKGVLNLFLSIAMAYNVISCRKVAENTEILKIAIDHIDILCNNRLKGDFIICQ